ncbi:MAG: hypothetical protein KBD50_02395 [Candidatus Pacebacteria bacterium]|nr:hypothetical protein [Candidatus Paceibacterota bacterium]
MTEPKPHMSFAAKFLLGSMGFFVIAAGVASYVFFGGANITSPQNIDVEVVAPSLVDGGKEVQFEIIIRNRNTSDLELADLVILYPKGTRSAQDPSQDLVHERQTIGVIKSGEEIKRTAHALLYGEEGEQQTVNVTLEYSVANSNAVFERSSQAQFLIGSSPVSLSVESPQETVSGQPFTLNVTVRSNATTPVNDLVIKGEFPFGFSVLSSEPRADAGGLWRLGSLQPGQSRSIRLSGTIEGSDGDERVFRFIAGATDDSTDPTVKVPYITIPKSLTVTRPFIGGTISIGGQTGKTITVSPGSKVSGTVKWQNNFSEPVTNVELALYFNGPAIEPGSIEGTDGFFQSSNNSIIWSKDDSSELESIAPGGSGTFQFSFRTKDVGSGGTLITNPVIDMNLSVRAVRPSSGAPEIIDSAATARASLASALSLSSQVLHFSGPFSNKGPMPPQVEKPTTYSVVWTVKNSSNAVGNGVVSATLPPYVRFVVAQEGSAITYNQGSRTVTWNLGDIKAGVGYTTSARTAAFQIEITPSLSQLGEVPVLVNAAKLSGQDRFAQIQLSAESEVSTTNLVGESGFQSGMDIVAPKQ